MTDTTRSRESKKGAEVTMTNEDMLYGPVWEKICDQLLANTWPPIEEAALTWARRKVTEHAELYDTVVQQTMEISQLNDFIEEVERDRDNARRDADASDDRVYNLENEIQVLRDELEVAREPKVD